MTGSLSKASIIKYGKANGYSDSEIKQATDIAKSRLINYGIDNGYKGSEINQALNSQGYENYNPILTKKNWENLLPNLKENAKDFARNARTISGQIIKPYVDDMSSPKGERMSRMRKRFIDAITSEEGRKTAVGAGVGATIGSIATPILRNIPVVKYLNPGIFGGATLGALGGLLGGPKELGNAITSTYETNIDEISNNPKEALQNIGQGAFRNPMYTGLDLLSAGGAKAVNKVGSGLGNAVSKDNLALQAIVPSKELREFNRTATNLMTTARADNAKMLGAFEQLNSDASLNRLEIAKDLITNDGKLNAKEKSISKLIKGAVGEAQQRLAANHILGMDKSINNTMAQYAMQKLMDKVPDIVQMDINHYIESGEVTGRLAEAVAKNPAIRQELDNVLDTAKKLQSQGDLAYITQILVKSKDPRNEIIANQIAKETGAKDYFSTNRYIGRGTYQDIADVLDESIKFQMTQVSKALEANDVVNGLLKENNIGKLAKVDELIPEGKIGISTKKLAEDISNQMNAGGNIDISRALGKARVSSKADDSTYIVDKIYSKAIDNMFKEGPRGSGRHLLSAFKKSVLAQPHWIALNRAGNWTNMSMAGVGLGDLKDAIKYSELTPKQLQQQTSFNNYLGATASGVRTSSVQQSLTKPWNNLGRSINKFKNSEKTLDDYGRAVADIYSNLSDTTSNLFFNVEAKLETIDRYADMIMHAKNMAKKTGGKWQDIIKKADKDNSLFNKLNTEVNKDLGDYVGKNYALPSWYYNTLSETIPFYRFLTQTGRTSLHQLANHPMGIQSSVILPGKAGAPLAQQVMKDNKFDQEKYQGGVPYRKDDDGNIRTIGGEPLPLQSVISETIGGDGLDWLDLISPGYKIASDTLRYRKGRDYIPSSKKLSELKKSRNKDDQAKAKNYRGTTGEKLAFGLNQFLGATFNPYAQAKTYLPELYGAIMNKPITRYYDASVIPFLERNVNYSAPLREIPAEQAMRWFGVQTRNNYPVKPKKPNRGSARYAVKNAKKEEQNKERIKNGKYNK